MPPGALNRLLWIGAIILLIGLGFQTRDNFEALFAGVGKLEVIENAERETVKFHWRGKIEAPMLSKLQEAFDRVRSKTNKIVLSLSSPGGSLDHGAKVIRLLRDIEKTHTLETLVEGRKVCASMCVPVFLVGQKRRAGANARFMFHEVSFHEVASDEDLKVPDAVIGSETDRFFAKYIKPSGVPEDWIKKIRREMSGGNDIWKTGQELVDEGTQIVQQIE